MESKIIRRRGNDAPAKEITLSPIGKIKIGAKAVGQNGKEYPTALDYFRCDATQDYQNLFQAAYGDKPDRLTICFISDNLGEICRNFYELRSGSGKRIADGDGVTFRVATAQANGRVKDVTVTPPDPEKWMEEMEAKAGTKWREALTLHFMLPGVPVFGYWVFRTHGENSTIPNIRGAIETMLNLAGRVRMIPFDLVVKKVKSDKEGAKSVYPVVELVANISQESAEKIAALPANFNRLLTEDRVAALAAGPAAEPEGFTDYAEVESKPRAGLPPADPVQSEFARIKAKCNNLQSVEDFNAAVSQIRTIKDKDLAGQMAARLGDEAQSKAMFYNQEKKAYCLAQ